MLRRTYAGREVLMIVKSGSVIRSGPLASPERAAPISLQSPHRPQEVGVATFLQGIAARRWSQIELAGKFSSNVAVMAQDRRRAATVLPFPIRLAGFYCRARSSMNDRKRMFSFKGLSRQQVPA